MLLATGYIWPRATLGDKEKIFLIKEKNGFAICSNSTQDRFSIKFYRSFKSNYQFGISHTSYVTQPMVRRDSIISGFHHDIFMCVRQPLPASGRGLCDIDRVWFRVTKSRVKNSKFLWNGNRPIIFFSLKSVQLRPTELKFIDTAVRDHWLLDVNEMSKSWNLPYHWPSWFKLKKKSKLLPILFRIWAWASPWHRTRYRN